MPSRRQFLAASAATVAAPAVHAAGKDAIRVALVGCGGRGSGAAANALQADPGVRLAAAADVFPDRLNEGVTALVAKFGDRADVPPDARFTGFDGYKQAIDAADVVVLASPPGFRPQHFAYAVEKNKHVFMEKPHAVDATGVRSVLESAKRSREKGLHVVAGFTYRYDAHKRDTVAKLRDGAVGDVQVVQTNYLTGELWDRSGKSKTPDPAELEYQLRMWYYFPWLSGDFLVEQAIHNVDKACWLMGDRYPVAAVGLGGRESRTAPKFGTVWDHFSVTYEYADGARVFLSCRQMEGCVTDTSDLVFGTKGTCNLMRHTIKTGDTTWRREGEHDLGKAYQREHDELFAAVRGTGPAVNDAERSALSSLMGIMGREAAYSGQRVTWEQMLKSQQSLVPTTLAWGPNPVPPPAKPGRKSYKFV